MMLSAVEIANLPGRELIAQVRLALQDEDWRIRGSEEAIVAAGLRRRPAPEALARADRFHALDEALDHAARAGPEATIGEFIQHLREAWRVATVRREIDASGAGDVGDDEPGDEGAHPAASPGRLQRA